MLRRVIGHRFIPFGVHEVAEYIFGAGLAFTGIHSSGRMAVFLIIIGSWWLVLGAFSKGTLGLVHVIPKAVHGFCDLVLIVALVISPLAAGSHIDWVAVGVGLGIALVMARISLWTVYAPTTPAPTGLAIPATSTPASAAPPRAATGLQDPATSRSVATGSTEPSETVAAPAGPGLARAAGRGAGVARRKAAAAGAVMGPAVGRGANRLGRVVGGARRLRAATQKQQQDCEPPRSDV